MKYSRKEIDKAGFALIGDDPFKRQQAVVLVTDWRQSHLPVLRELNEELTTLLVKNGIPFEFSSHRIKRMQSIVEKIRNNKNMGLGGLQDIGGVRFVFPDMETLSKADEAIKDYTPKNFTLKKSYDYISDPKESGYRSIHHVYKFSSENEEHDGLQIELQIRTKLQHSWAMAVETASLISGTSLKASIKDGSVWREFFKLVNAVFSIKESTALHERFKGYTEWRFCDEYSKFLKEYKLLDQLMALQVTVNADKHKEIEEGYCVLSIDFRRKMVHFNYFGTEQDALASDLFTDMEKGTTNDEAVLMVSMKKMSELRKAYPSYFLDTKDFLSALQEFDDMCAFRFKSDYYKA